MRSLFTLLLLALPAVAADPPAHRADGDAAIAARRVLLAHCSACHGDPDPKHGRLKVSDWGTLTGSGTVPFVALNMGDRSQVLDFMTDGSMPPGGRKPVPREEVATVRAWIERGAKPFPDGFDDEAVLKMIADDVSRVEKEKGKEYVQFVRYVSLAHLADKKGADLAATEAELLTALVGRTHGATIRLTKAKLDAAKKEPAAGTPNLYDKAFRPVVGSAGTLFRLDLKELGWDGGKASCCST